jgi:tetratricopeptide (TPR) repeat protein
MLAALLSAAFVFYPIPGFGQQSGSQSASGSQNGGESSEASAGGEGESSGSSDEGVSRTPDVFLLPTDSVRDQISEIVPERVGEMLRSRLDSEGRINLLPSFRKLTESPSGSGAGNAALKEARQSYTSGIGLVEAGNYEEAADQFSGAVETMRKNIAELDNFNIYTDALANLARSYWEIGHNYDARKSIREFAHLRPDADLNPKKYAKGLRDLYDKEVQRVEKAGPGKLVIESNVEGAEVLIDGEKKGEAPVTVEDTAFGHHYLVVRAQGEAKSKKLQVRGRGKTQKYKVELDVGEGTAKAEESGGSAEEEKEQLPAFYTELRSTIKGGNFASSNLEPYLEELADQAEVDFISWVVMVKDDSEYVAAPFVYRVSDGMFVQPENVSFNFQLSDLTVGVSELHSRIMDAIEEMPEDRAVESVALADDEKKDGEKMASGDAAAQQAESTGTSQGEPVGGTTTESIDAPPEPKPSNKGSAWKYVGIAGAILAAGGLAAGGAFLLAGPNDGTKPSGFTANVEW